MIYLRNVIKKINVEENLLDIDNKDLISKVKLKISDLFQTMSEMKEYVLEKGFETVQDEIEFFKEIKPVIQARLIYYNKVYRTESNCPLDIYEVRKKYYIDELQKIERNYYENCGCSFFRYYISGRNDKDEEYFVRGKIDWNNGLNRHILEADYKFSTYYDYRVSRILCDQLLHNYLFFKINDEAFNGNYPDAKSFQLEWTGSKSTLIELIYALHANQSISNGKTNIRKLCAIAEVIFNLDLKDLHHTFHRMKTRSGSRTSFLDQLKVSLEEYMDRDL